MARATARSYRGLTEEQERRAERLRLSSLVIDAIGSAYPLAPATETLDSVLGLLHVAGVSSRRPDRTPGLPPFEVEARLLR